MSKYFLFEAALIIFGLFLTSCKDESRLFVGGFTKPGAKGLSVFDFNKRSGHLKLLSESDAGLNPVYFCISKKHDYIYAANEVMDFKGIKGGGVTTLSYNVISGGIEKINELAVPNGGPCFISMSAREDFLFIANYAGGSVVVVKLDDKGIPVSVTDSIIYQGEEGKESHAHMITTDPSGEKVYVTDLGLDRIMVYNFDKNTGKFNQADNDTVSLPVGSGPRHFVFNANGSKMYVINELGSKMMVFNIDENDGPELIQTLPTFRKGFEGNNYCADVHIGKSGKFLYGSNRGENTIVTFRIESDGTLALAGHTSCGGDWPRNFVIDPSGKFLLVGNQKSDNISVFKLNQTTGLPNEPAKHFEVTAPACLKFFK